MKKGKNVQFVKSFLTSKGRVGRLFYSLLLLFLVGLMFLAGLMFLVFHLEKELLFMKEHWGSYLGVLSLLFVLFFLVLLFFMIMNITARRLHDLNLSAWWNVPVFSFPIFVTVLFLFVFALEESLDYSLWMCITTFLPWLFLCFTSGTKVKNRFGPVPKSLFERKEV